VGEVQPEIFQKWHNVLQRVKAWQIFDEGYE
jgi:hypothetical protein